MIKYPYKISNKQLYERCDSSKVSLEVTRRRWNALGHVLRPPKTTPCWRSMVHFSNQDGLKTFRGRTRITLVTTINEDIKLFEPTNQEAAAIFEIATLEILENLFHLARIAAERKCWKNITNAIHFAAQATQS